MSDQDKYVLADKIEEIISRVFGLFDGVGTACDDIDELLEQYTITKKEE